MDNLPLELHHQIIQFACTDDGTTARALSRVSRYIHRATTPFFYQSVALEGHFSIRRLVEKLQSSPLYARRIRSIFICDSPHGYLRQKGQPSELPEGYSSHAEVQQAAIMDLLDLVKPFVEIMTVIIDNPLHGQPIFGHLFSLWLPRLHSLSVHGYYPLPSSPCIMPRLEHLHLSGHRNPLGLFDSGALAESCPKIRSLRISGIVAACRFVEELSDFILLPTSPSLVHLIPHDLLTIVVSPGTAPIQIQPSRRPNFLIPRHSAMISMLNDLEAQRRGSDRPRLMVPGEAAADMYSVMKGEWLKLAEAVS